MQDLLESQSQIVCTQSSGSQIPTEADLLSEPLILPQILELDQVYYTNTTEYYL